MRLAMRTKARGLCLCLLVNFFALTAAEQPATAQVYSAEQLFDLATNYYHQQDFLNSAVFLFAYLQRSPQAMDMDAKFADQVRKAYQFSHDQVVQQLQQLKILAQSQAQGEYGKKTSGLTYLPPLEKPGKQTSQAGYTLVLRGGGNLSFQYTPYSNFFKQPQIWITCERGAVGVGQNQEKRYQLNPGQAAWLDRPISANEPTRLIIPIGRNDFSISWNSGQVTGTASALPWLNRLQDPNQFQAFRAYNDGKGNLIVVKAE